MASSTFAILIPCPASHPLPCLSILIPCPAYQFSSLALPIIQAHSHSLPCLSDRLRGFSMANTCYQICLVCIELPTLTLIRTLTLNTGTSLTVLALNPLLDPLGLCHLGPACSSFLPGIPGIPGMLGIPGIPGMLGDARRCQGCQDRVS